MKTAFLGKTVSGPFTIPSGIVSTAPSIIQRIMDELPEVGVITTKSVGPVPRTGNREPVYSQYAPGCFVNAVGLTNPGAEEARRGLNRSPFQKTDSYWSLFLAAASKNLCPWQKSLHLWPTDWNSTYPALTPKVMAWPWGKILKWSRPL